MTALILDLHPAIELWKSGKILLAYLVKAYCQDLPWT